MSVYSIYIVYYLLFIPVHYVHYTIPLPPTPYSPPIICPRILQMPKMSGLEAILEIRRLEAQAGCEGVYIIAFTADLSETSERSLMNAGANEVCMFVYDMCTVLYCDTVCYSVVLYVLYICMLSLFNIVYDCAILYNIFGVVYTYILLC